MTIQQNMYKLFIKPHYLRKKNDEIKIFCGFQMIKNCV